MVVCVKMMSKGSKETLTVLIVTHATHVERVESNLFVAFTQHCIQSNVTHLTSKGSKEALTVLIVTYVTHVERVESGDCGLCTQYRYIQCYVERVKRLCYVETRDKHIFAHNFLSILPIFDLQKVLES